ncbi:MAG TPA: type II secretion system F family protein [Acidimicrobiales bacterium]|nr:type II secretion system F family protein [Acidimicrobiales bacterium]
MLIAVAVGAVAALVTGWVVALPIGVLGALGLPALLRKTTASQSVTKIESIATWTEMLQGTLAASAGLSQAIVATAPLSPSPIRAETCRLAALLEAGAHPRDALLRFAEEVDDPSADRVVCALLLSYESRGQRLGDLLAALADSTREDVALRLRVETSRSSVRSSVRTVLVFSVVFAVSLLVLARSYLAPFGTARGQLVLLVVALLYATGLASMVALARPPAPVRLLGRSVASG